MTLEEALQTALAYENKVYQRYAEAEQQVSDEIGRRVFRVLAAEERQHIEYLESRLAEWQDTGHIVLDVLNTVIPSSGKIANGLKHPAIPPQQTTAKTIELQLLENALRLEQETSAFYQRMVSELDEEGKKLFARFVEIEEGHVAIVQAQIDSVTGLGFWFDMCEFKLEGG